MIKSLLKDAQFDRIKVSQAAGQATITSDAVDMSGYEGALFKITLGTIAAGGLCTCKLQQCATSGGSYADLEGTSIVNTGDDAAEKIMLLELINPSKRYIKLVAVTSVANVGIDSIDVIKFGAKKVPVTQSGDVDVSEQHIGPDEGTA